MAASRRGEYAPAPMALAPEDKSSSLSIFRRKGEERPQLAVALAAGKVVGDFALVSLIGQGGMGQIWEAEQLSLKRRVAVKFVRPERVTEYQLELFAREARAGGRLSHPGLVTIHGYGQSDGLAWIAMELVSGGWTLKDFLDEAVRSAEVPEGYDRHVAVLVAEIAEAMQTAHDAGVIHRDLKPQNILITGQDRPKVTDFGLARITDETALSMTGDFAGTYLYMSPEQAQTNRVDHRTDIFSLGAVLYELLALRRPFEGDTPHQVAEQIVFKDPPDPRTIRSRVPRDLVVIAEKALEKERDKRFSSMRELAADLRRHLANEPIRAAPPTRGDRIVKWVRRNPGRSSAVAVAAVAVATISVLLVANVRANRSLAQTNTELSSERTNLANANTALAERTREAVAKRDEVLKLSALQDLDDLLAEADDLWPAHPALIFRFEEWFDDAGRLVVDLPIHREKRADLRSRALPRTAEERAAECESHPRFARLGELEDRLVRAADAAAAASSEDAVHAAEAELTRLEAERDQLELELDERRDWRFPEDEPETRWWNNQLTKLIEGLEALEAGLLAEDATTAAHGWSVPKRLRFARTIEERTLRGPEASDLWARAVASIRDVEACPAYGGMELTPRLGLLPIGRDPDSGLWEFAHLQTGEIAQRDGKGRLILSEAIGLVFVLLPGGPFRMGAQNSDPNAPNYDPGMRHDENPVHAVTLSPFFLSKYEMTQGQWERFTGTNPSNYGPARYLELWNSAGKGWSALQPVDQVSWWKCAETMERLALGLPTEAQWEYACRAGTSTVYWSGDEPQTLQGVANLTDAFARANYGDSWGAWELWLDDGQTGQAEIGNYRSNAFGLHDVHGNLWEWCQDAYDASFYRRSAERDPVALGDGTVERVSRGGSYFDLAKSTRSSIRNNTPPELTGFSLGLRPTATVVSARGVSR